MFNSNLFAYTQINTVSSFGKTVSTLSGVQSTYAEMTWEKWAELTLEGNTNLVPVAETATGVVVDVRIITSTVTTSTYNYFDI